MGDEMWHFVNGEKTNFGCSEPLMGYRVNLSDTNRTDVSLKQLIKKVDNGSCVCDR